MIFAIKRNLHIVLFISFIFNRFMQLTISSPYVFISLIPTNTDAPRGIFRVSSLNLLLQASGVFLTGRSENQGDKLTDPDSQIKNYLKDR